MGRTKMEVDALTNKIYTLVRDRQDKRVKSFISNATKIYKVRVKPLRKNVEAAIKAYNKELNKLIEQPFIMYPSSQTEESLIRDIAIKLAKVKFVTRKEVEEAVIISGDQGADVLVKKITEMFL